VLARAAREQPPGGDRRQCITTKGLNEDVVPRVSQAPGFQAGYWTWKDNTGLSMVVFDSEDGANQAGDQVRAMVESIDAVELQSVEVREVVAHA
jgi:hypothetical protein